MTKRERLQAAFSRQPVDRPPISLWRHFPEDDLEPDSFANRIADFQRSYDFDLVKVTPASGYTEEMYGAQLKEGHNRQGTRQYVTRVVNQRRDWSDLRVLNEDNPVWQREIRSLELIRQQIGEDAPLLQTVFSPSYTARALAGDRFFTDLRERPEVVHTALEALTETTSRFAADCLSHGATAIFFATQLASREHFTDEEYRTFGVPYDLAVLGAVEDLTDFFLLHVHGVDIYFDLFVDYPVQAINWHDRRTAPSLREGKRKFGGAVAGGLNEWDTLVAGSVETVRSEIAEAVAQTEGRGLLVTGGCVIPVDTPETNLRAAVAAVKEGGGG
ncbi:MAG: uroporphyrinogen decarboxylase [Armatimonadetes bacterium]|nr:uroporphyrinogen decarboxylase [Armatimonadota bacterium]